MESPAGGGTLSDLYQNARRLLLRTRDALEKLERLDSSSFSSASYSSLPPSSTSTSDAGLDPTQLAASIKRDVTQIQSLCTEMNRLLRSIGFKGQRDLWKRKVDQASEEADSLGQSLDKHTLRQQRRVQEVKERAELLRRANGDSEHILRIFDDETRAMQSARNSHMMLDEAFATGVAVLSKYAEQRDRLKRIQRKALDVLNTVGLSSSLLKVIEKRLRVDRRIAYAGMIITVLITVAFWRWTH